MPIGKSMCLASGLALTNSYVERTATVQNFAKTTIMFETVKRESGVAYYVRGQPVIGYTAYQLIASGEILTSGSYTILTSGLDDAYEQLNVGVKARQSNRSGAVTILISRRRH